MIDYASSAMIALGANLPRDDTPPHTTLETALDMLPGTGLTVEAVSSFFRTAAVPLASGPDFVNACALISSRHEAISAADILAALHDVEAALGRERRQRWAPRVCDLDLIAMGETILPDRETVARWMALAPGDAVEQTPGELILPHPRMHERAFVLAPLAEIAPDWRHPLLGVTVAQMLLDLGTEDVSALRRLPGRPCKSPQSG
ncbi:MAG: 2-amino-4-hydroxy-6-hydroxymethyldihydropteridine diphosphokinase [Pseudomonadota bacterium]